MNGRTIADERHRRALRVEIAPRTLAAIVVLLAGIWLVGQLWAVLAVIVTALMLVGALNPLVTWLEDHGFRRHWALAVVFATFAGALLVLCLVTLPALWTQVQRIVENMPTLQKDIARKLATHRATAAAAEAVRRYRLSDATAEVDARWALTLSLNIAEFLGYALTTVMLAIYLMADHERMRGVVYALVPRRFHVRLARVVLNLEIIVGGYIRGQVITSMAIGLFVFALLSLCRVPDALALAAFASLTDVIPFVGGLLATTPSVLSALSRGPTIALAVLLAMIVYQELESRLLVPRVYGRVLRLPSSAVVVALLIGGKLGGILGALLALPLAAGLRMLVDELRIELPGVDTDQRAVLARDARAERLYRRRSQGASAKEAAQVAVGIAENIQETDKGDKKDAEAVAITAGAKE